MEVHDHEWVHHPAADQCIISAGWGEKDGSRFWRQGFSRDLLPASAIKGIKLYNDESGFAKSFIIIIATILLGILIAGLTIYFKLK